MDLGTYSFRYKGVKSSSRKGAGVHECASTAYFSTAEVDVKEKGKEVQTCLKPSHCVPLWVFSVYRSS